MQFSQIIRTLTRHPLIMAIGVIVSIIAAILVAYSVTLSPFKVHARESSSGAARTFLYMDYSRSTLVQVPANQDAATLLNFDAQIVGRMIDSGQIRSSIARDLGVVASGISVQGPFPNNVSEETAEPSSQERANEILGESSKYSVYVTTDAIAPTVTIFTQAPSGPGAIRLANATADALSKYLSVLQQSERPGERQAFEDYIAGLERSSHHLFSKAEIRNAERQFFNGRVVLRQAGRANGGSIASQSGRVLMVATFIGVLVAWSLMIVLVSRARMALRDDEIAAV
jgi:hypothetical protein